MQKTNVPFKVAVGYGAVAIVLVLAISLVYSNTQSILSINQASREYIQKRDAADSTMSALLKDEQANLKQLSDAMAGKESPNYLREKVKSLNNGKDSIVVHPKAPKTHEAKNTTVEVIKTRKGFFRRLADAFKKEHAETLCVIKDSNQAVIDSITAPVNVAENVADILEQIEKKEKKDSKNHSQAVSKEMADLQMVNAQIAIRSAQQLNDVHQRERDSMQQAINKAMVAREHLLWQIGLLAIVAILAAIILLGYIYRDIRKERIYRENLEEANTEIQRIMNQRERLLLTITHDIKAPAASISGFIDLMKDDVKNERGHSCLANIKSSACHLSKLVASLLDYHQLENGQMEIHPVTFSPIQLVKQSVNSMKIQAKQKGLEISCQIRNQEKKNEEGKTSASTPSITDSTLFEADAFRIRQILDNLVSNAIKYTDKGAILVTASIIYQKKTYHTDNKDNYQFTLSVKDTGKGMTTEECKKVFQAFTRLKSAQGIEGTGLGLSITHELVTLLGGNIFLQSDVGKGSTFTVNLPLTLAPQGQKTSEEDDTQIQQKGEQEESKPITKENTFANHKVLILDDDKLQLQLLQEMLRRLAGDTWQVFACNHVAEALTFLHDKQPAIMMMDIEMPEMSGIELIKHINHSHMTVIAMTAHDTSIKQELLQAGFDDCLFKPFQMESLEGLLGIEKRDNCNINEDKKTSVTDDHKSSQLRFQPLLTFAEGDKVAEAEIFKTVKEELEGYCKGIEKELKESFDIALKSSNTTSNTLNKDNIGKIAHKLLPIASMLQMDSCEHIKALSPEHIMKLDSNTAHIFLQETLKELRGILEEMIVLNG